MGLGALKNTDISIFYSNFKWTDDQRFLKMLVSIHVYEQKIKKILFSLS